MKTLLMGSLAVAGCIGLACSPAVTGGGSTGGAPGSGGAAATGGTVANTGGVVGSTGGVVGNTGGVVGNTGGVVGNTGGVVGNTGGVVGNTGGVVGNTGGVDAGSTGGTTAGGVTCSGTAWSVTSGKVDDGTWCGYGYTSAWPKGSDTTITPADFAGLDMLCASGVIEAEVAADEANDITGYYPGIMIAFQVQSDGSTDSTWAAAGTGLSYDITVAGTATDLGTIRLWAKKKGGATDGYSYWLPMGSGTGKYTADWSDFSTEAWPGGAGDTLAAGDEIVEVGVQLGGRESGAQTVSNFCINSVSRL